jgi:hypothetical protein
MYRDVVQWSKIRHRILVQGRSIRRVASEKGIDPRTIRKMLDHALPQPRMARGANRYPKLSDHTRPRSGDCSLRTLLSLPRPVYQSRTSTSGFAMRKASAVRTTR